MKRTTLLLLLLAGVLLLAPLIGCGKQADDREQTTDRTQQTALTTDNDTFQLLMLDRMIQTPDTGVTELLGDGDDQTYDADGNLATRVYHGTLFGQEVSYTIFFSLDDVTKAVVTFPVEISSDDLTPLITKQLELESKDDGAWHTDTALVTTQTTDGHTEIACTSYSLTEDNS